MCSSKSTKALKESTRTPFGRAQTMFAGTPMDAEIVTQIENTFLLLKIPIISVQWEWPITSILSNVLERADENFVSMSPEAKNNAFVGFRPVRRSFELWNLG